MATARQIGEVIKTVPNPLFQKEVRKNPTVNLPLFGGDDAAVPEVIPAPTTRQQSWRMMVDSGKLSEKQFEVLSAVERLRRATDHQIAEFLNWEINCVTGRRNELMQMGYVTKYDEIIDRKTRRPRARWELTK